MLSLRRLSLSLSSLPSSSSTSSAISFSFRSLSVVKVGDKVPVNYVKDRPAPVIKDDKEYPFWLNSVADKVTTASPLT